MFGVVLVVAFLASPGHSRRTQKSFEDMQPVVQTEAMAKSSPKDSLATLLFATNSVARFPRMGAARRKAFAEMPTIRDWAGVTKPQDYFDPLGRFNHVAAATCQMCDTIPESAKEGIPAGELADAWRRDEKAKELADTLKGCSIYIVGFGGARKAAVGKVLSRRLPRYRFYDVNSIMCSTYAAMGDGESVNLQQLVAKEPVADVTQLSHAVMREVQQLSRTILVAWDGAVEQQDFMVMQQGLVVNLIFEASDEQDVALPAEGAEEVRATWEEGHKRADVTVELEAGLPADDAAYKVVDALLAFIEANPAKSKAWKETADEKLQEQDDA